MVSWPQQALAGACEEGSGAQLGMGTDSRTPPSPAWALGLLGPCGEKTAKEMGWLPQRSRPKGSDRGGVRESACGCPSVYVLGMWV